MSDYHYTLEDVPQGKELLWWFDENLLHDLICLLYQPEIGILSCERILIQRHTRWNYPYFAHKYSEFLYGAIQGYLPPFAGNIGRNYKERNYF